MPQWRHFSVASAMPTSIVLNIADHALMMDEPHPLFEGLSRNQFPLLLPKFTSVKLTLANRGSLTVSCNACPAIAADAGTGMLLLYSLTPCLLSCARNLRPRNTLSHSHPPFFHILPPPRRHFPSPQAPGKVAGQLASGLPRQRLRGVSLRHLHASVDSARCLLKWPVTARVCPAPQNGQESLHGDGPHLSYGF